MKIISQFIGLIFTCATLPGIIIHEIAHRFFCDITNTPVYEVKYFELSIENKYAGRVLHGSANSLTKTALICLGPLLINTFLCIIFSIPFAMALGARAESVIRLPHIILLWVAFSSGVHAIPSSTDVQNLTDYIDKNKNLLINFLFVPIRILFFLARILSFFWFDAVYSLGIIWFNCYFFKQIFSLFDK